MTAPSTMREYALLKTDTLLTDVVSAIGVVRRTPEAEPVHKMRVAIRRLQQALRLFRQYLDAGGQDEVKTSLRAIMQVAGELRNRDIAIDLVAESGGDNTELLAQRTQFEQQLRTTVEDVDAEDLLPRWRGALGLESA